jgi:CRP-like cAMP-binding protein
VVAEHDLHELRKVGSEVEIDAGQVVIERGHPGAGLYVVLDGTVVVETSDGPRELGAGACIGERALVSSEGVRTARVKAATPVRLLAVERVEFERLCAADPTLADRLVAEGR